MLIAVKNYMTRQGVTSLQQLALHFQVEPDAMRGMLEHWIRKGRVRRQAACHRSACSGCDPAVTECYWWVEPETPPPDGP